jgi:YD repeat-containing protein
MPEIAGSSLRGPVRNCRHELSEWDEDHQVWKPSYGPTIVSFRPDGQVIDGQSHNPDGSISRWVHAYDTEGRLVEERWWKDDEPTSTTVYAYDGQGRPTGHVEIAPDGTRRETETCTYDGSGRKTKRTFLPVLDTTNVCYGVEGSQQAYGAPGASTMTTSYDERGRPAQAIFQDANQAIVRRVTFTRDEAGRVLAESVEFGDAPPFPDALTGTGGVPSEYRAKMATLLAEVFANQTFSTTTYVYDSRGRVVERITRMGNLSEDRTTFRYNDRADPVEESEEHRSRGANLDDQGVMQATDERSHTSQTRYEYRYDEYGNWTERIVWSRHDSQSDFRRSNLIRRAITYY